MLAFLDENPITASLTTVITVVSRHLAQGDCQVVPLPLFPNGTGIKKR